MSDTATKDLLFAVSLYGESVFRAWMKSCWDRGFAHGSELVYTITGTDNNWKADRLLEAAEKAGWVLRADRPSPDFSQAVFLSLEGPSGRRSRYPREYGFSPNRASTGALQFVKG